MWRIDRDICISAGTKMTLVFQAKNAGRASSRNNTDLIQVYTDDPGQPVSIDREQLDEPF